MSKQFVIVLAIIVLLFLGIFSISNHKNTKVSSSPSSHIEGLDKSGVSLIEYGDYQCPYCGEYYSTVKQVQAQYNNEISFQFVNFPLTSIHQNAFAGARAAEAANLQGKFWQMHDLLYEENQVYYDSNQSASTWINSSNPLTQFDQYARQLGLNVSKFNTDYASNQVDNVINADENKGNALGVDATPTFYLDGKQIQVDNSVSSFTKFITAAIAQKAQAAK